MEERLVLRGRLDLKGFGNSGSEPGLCEVNGEAPFDASGFWLISQ